ncbi:EAL domain-containing protein [Erythrobacter sp. sf7]|uniref:EAL domain-containing protein n=1 Tax=Erythrobacter fulvus TaxID=2987523 RepID=A0ABT5JV85_9SPHN|nr:EAL domain-containing protein [Erythrobacter fulvus]MDC8755442.1 EAL domain-containing protein [Erythrobacter fulvus]
MTGVTAAGVAAWVAESDVINACFLVLTIVAAARVFAAHLLSPGSVSLSTQALEIFYEIGAYSYALVLGVLAALTLWMPTPADAKVLMVANALCYGVAVAARNAGRPKIAIGQLAIVVLPILATCFLIGSASLIALGATIVLLIPAMASITMNLFQVLRHSIASAENNAELAARMQVLAHTDVVTGLANRTGLNHAASEAIAGLGADDRLALIWIDLDRFKEVNDLLGHPVGDQVLCEVAKRIAEVCSDQAIVSRFGGDEFVIVTPIMTRKDAEHVASEIHAQMMRPFLIDGDRLEVRVSVGVAILPEDGDDTDTLMQRADLALYHAKSKGRAQTCFFDHAMTRQMAKRREIEADLRKALKQNELSVFFQPIVDLESGRIKTFEALVRWFHPEKGEISPAEFIPVAEETGMILTLGNWVTAQAAKVAMTWPADVNVAVNLSPLQIRAPGASLGIKNALQAAQLDPRRLEIEVTETLLIEDNHATTLFISELSELGVKFALDDFGTGFSSLSYINTFPFSKIKVDRSFVSSMQVGRRSEAIIRAVAEMGSTLGMEIVAEGVEDIEQLQAVRAAGCTLGQGYYFSRAVPDHLAAILLSKERDSDAQHATIARATG